MRKKNGGEVDENCCALCPFGLTCQWFGMVWDAGNDVGLNKLLFLYIIVCFAHFCNHFIWGVWASPTLAQSWACRTAQRGHNKNDGRIVKTRRAMNIIERIKMYKNLTLTARDAGEHFGRSAKMWEG